MGMNNKSHGEGYAYLVGFYSAVSVGLRQSCTSEMGIMA